MRTCAGKLTFFSPEPGTSRKEPGLARFILIGLPRASSKGFATVAERETPPLKIRLATAADQRRLSELLGRQLEEHSITLAVERLSRVIQGVLERPERGALWVAAQNEPFVFQTVAESVV